MHLRSFIHRDMAYSDLLHFWSQTDVYQSPDRSSEYEGTLAVHSAPESPGISDSNQTASPASSDGSTLIGDFFPRMRKSLSAYVDSPSSPDRSDAGVDLAKETTFDSSTTHSLALPEGNDEWVTLFDHEYPTKIAYLWDILQGGENVAEGVLPSHPDGFTGAFLSQLSGAKDYQASPWTLPSSSQKMDHLKFDDIQRDAHRSLSYTVLHSKMAVETRILHHNKRSVVYLHESSCSGVPYSDAFQAVTRIHLTQGNVSTRHRVEFRVQFQKHVPWVAQKSLEQGLLYRFREYYEKLDVTLKKVLGVTTSRPYHMERRGSSPLFNTLGNPSYTAALTNRSLRRKSHLNKTMENSPILVVMTWVFLAYGIYATLQLQSQLDSLMSKLEGN